ncbi:unnamed protein product [Camellia sinensis]
MFDFTGVPAVVDLACMRDAMNKLGSDSNKINPFPVLVDLVIDHSVQVDVARSENAVHANMELESQRRGVASWGVGGIKAEATMLGQPMSMVLPGVVGFQLFGKLRNGVTATDFVLSVTQMLRKHGVVGKFVEFYGNQTEALMCEGVGKIPLANRTTIANMSPEYGATMGFFLVDHVTLQYLRLTGRSEDTVAMIEAYLHANNMFVDYNEPQQERVYSSYLHLDLVDVEPCISGPKSGFAMPKEVQNKVVKFLFHGQPMELNHGSVVIAAIMSCTNTSNPSVMLGAGLVAKKACELGQQVKSWIKTSLALGSGVVTKYLLQSGLQKCLNEQGFHIVGYGCTTCIGNSGDLDDSVASAISENDIAVAAILSGNWNFEGRVHPLGLTLTLRRSRLGLGRMKDIWPSTEEVAE